METNMRGISRLELMPEPEDPSLLTAVDRDAPGYSGESYGISDEEARRLRGEEAKKLSD